MRSLGLVIIIPLMATAALAQTSATKTPSGQAASSQTPVDQQALQEQVRKNLEQAGFTDIKMMPSSFLVRAKDKQGNPVMMVINPDLLAAVTEVPGNNMTTGEGSQENQSSQGTSPGEAPSGKE